MEVKGILEEVMPVEVISTNNGELRKQKIVVLTEGEYPQYVVIDFIGKGLSQTEGLVKGSTVNVAINLNGRKYVKDGQTRYFTSVSGWKVDVLSGSQALATPQEAFEAQDDDLPF